MNKASIVALVAMPIVLASCIKAEQANTECDIEAVSLHLEDPTNLFYHEYDTIQTVISTENDIVFVIRSYTNIQSVPVTFRITNGATLYVKDDNGVETLFQNGSSIDLSNERVYHFRVVSEDRVWSRDYSLSVVHDIPSEGNLTIDFEKYYLDSSDYPSTPAAGQGPDGSDCLKLETCDTGPFGRMVNMRLASGSMFNGIFNVSLALTDALKSTQFGSPFTHKPIQFRVWLRFEPGSFFHDLLGQLVEGVMDEPDAYVVLYRNEDAEGNKIQLDGNDVLSSPHIVALGRLPHYYNEDGTDKLSNAPIHGVTNEWQEFTIPVEYRAEIDAEVLENKGYSLIISFASSWQGAHFMGAIGSKLYIDNIQLFCE